MKSNDFTNRAPRYRLPVQQRSRERFDRLLDAAAEILAEGGYDALTTNRVAEDAGVPIGSLYQFFPDKQAVAAALTDRYAEEVRKLCDHTLTVERAREDLVAFIGALVEGISELQLRNAGFLCIFAGGTPNGPYAQLTRELRNMIFRHLDLVLVEAYPEVPSERRRLVLRTMAETAAAMTGTLELEKEKNRPIVVEEMKLMLGHYVAARFAS